jgi:phosphopantetheinyl transferase (holo-ACP synthase)
MAATAVDIATVPPSDAGREWQRWLRPAEVEACMERGNPVLHLAARHAAKRAALALLGWPGPGGELDVEVVGMARDRPRLVLHGAVAEWAQRSGTWCFDVSLSHSAGYAGAMVVGARSRSSELPAAPRCGFDLLDTPRWELALRRSGRALVERITGAAERVHDANAGVDSFVRSGARFALKECVVKALGGLPDGGSFHDIEVMFDVRGRPRVACRHLMIEEATTTTRPDLLMAGVVGHRAL